MSVARRIGTVAAVAVAALALAGAASAHAYLLRTSPSASVILTSPPSSVSLTFDEAVEPRFATISVTDAIARQQTTGPPTRSPSDVDTLVVPLRPHLAEGWYLVYWRAISIDGHPVQGAFTFAVGPNQGPAPQFVVPKISATATTPRLLVARWAMFLTVMSAIGLFVLRILIARPVVRRVRGASLRAVSVAFAAASILALIAIPVYLDVATSVDSLRSAFAVGELLPLYRVTAFGRSYVDLELCFALFALAGLIAIRLDRPDRPLRSLAAIGALAGALLAAAAVLAVPGAAGHAAQTAPRGLSLILDWLHLVSGSIWIGGLIGLLVLWRSLRGSVRTAGLAICVPRFSGVAFASVFVLLGSGIAATVIHLPTVASLWQTSYGQAILVKAALLAAAMTLGAVNLLVGKPRLAGAERQSGNVAATPALLRRTMRVETLLVAAAIFAAAVLSSLAPPAAALAKEGSALAHVGPGRVVTTVRRNGYTLRVLVSPNRAVATNAFTAELTRNGAPVRGADVTLEFEMLDMEMANQVIRLAETRPGVYSLKAPALVMVGHWGLSFDVTPRNGAPFTAFIVDHAAG